MKIRHLQLKNWKNFQSLDLECHDRLFIVGPNASGKSNLLDVFRFLKDLSTPDMGLRGALSSRGWVTLTRNLSAPDSEIIIIVDIEDDSTLWEYELSFLEDQDRRLQIKREIVSRNGTIVIDRPDQADKQDPRRLVRSCLEPYLGDYQVHELTNFFASISSPFMLPQLLRRPKLLTKQLKSLFGESFLEQAAKLPAEEVHTRLGLLKEELGRFLPQLQKLEFVYLQDLDSQIPSLCMRPESSREIILSHKYFSDGTLSLLAILWEALNKGGPLLLEEPEQHLYPDIVQWLPSMLHGLQRQSGRQVFMSTHSPDFLKDGGIGLDEVLLLKPAKEGITTLLAQDDVEIRKLIDNGFSLADVAMPNYYLL